MSDLNNKFEKMIERATVDSENERVLSNYGKLLENQNLTRRKRNKAIGLIGVLLLLISLAFLFLNKSNNDLSTELLLDQYASNLRIYIDPEVATRNSISEKSDLIEIQSLLNAGDFEEGIKRLHAFSGDANINLRTFLLAQAYFKNNEFNNALAAINKIENNHLVFQEELLWLKTLTFLKLKENDQAESLLKNTVENKSYKWTESKKILTKLINDKNN